MSWQLAVVVFLACFVADKKICQLSAAHQNVIALLWPQTEEAKAKHA